jgi:aspartate beta-hydroxylase
MTTVGPAAAGDLLAKANTALQRGDAAAALACLDQASARGEVSLDHHIARAVALRITGDFAGAVGAADAALALDPFNLMARVSKGFLLERLGRPRAAAAAYRAALEAAPADHLIPAGLRGGVERARAVVAADADAMQAFLTEQLIGVRGQFDGQPLARFDEAVAIMSGKAQAQVQQPLMLHYPEMPAIAFYDRVHFPWLETLEAATPTIQRELAGLLEASRGDFQPYIDYPPDAPVNQFAELNHSPKWSSAFLWRDGARNDAACAVCPQTAALMETLPLARLPGFAPTVNFSALQPHTRIPTHTGSTNTRLLVHLPLTLPGPARFRVGNYTRDWRMGEAWVFDDTINHEAWNDADQLRVILIIDIWNPFLSEAERELVSAMLSAARAYRDG